MEPCHLKPREVAMRAGEKCDYMYVVYSGRVVLQGAMDQQAGGRGVRPHGSQRERHCRPGEVFNEGALMHNAGVDTTAVSSGMCQLWRLHRLAFKVLQMERGMRDRKERARFLRGVEVFRKMNLSSGARSLSQGPELS